MGHNQQEQFVQIPLDMEHNRINQTSDSNQRRSNWLTIVICIILAVIGQSIARLLENYFFLHRNRTRRYGVWTQSLLQVIGFPILIFPFLLFLIFSSKKHNKQLLMTSYGISLKHLALYYPIIAMYMFFQANFYNSKNRIPFRVFTLIYTAQVLFTPVFSICFNKIKFNRWMIISLVFSILTGAFTLYTFSAGSPIYNPNKHNYRGISTALFAAAFFSLLLCNIRIVFEQLISTCNESTNRRNPSFVVVLELLFFSSFLATLCLVAAVFISGEHDDLKGQMDGFLKGEIAYVRTMVGLVIAWQVYWVGIVGLVFSVSAVFSNVVSVCTWPVVSLLVALIYNKYEEYHVLSGTALATAALSVASYFYLIHSQGEESR